MPNINDLVNHAKTSAQQLGIKKFDIYGSAVDETKFKWIKALLNKSKLQIALV